MKSQLMTISDVAALYGVTLRALRFYEARGLINPQRIGTSRFYSPADRARLELILKGKRLCFTLSEVEALILTGPRDPTIPSDPGRQLDRTKIIRQIETLQRQYDEISAAIDELRSVGEMRRTGT